jgi:arylsulfatase A-like enzyme
MTWRFFAVISATCFAFVAGSVDATRTDAADKKRHNILFAFADDWGRHASAYAKVDGPGGLNDVVQTPNFDRLAGRGVLFRNAYVNAPSCTPCRSSLLSGQYFWRTGRGAILRGAVWDSKIPTYPLLLNDAGYHIGKTFKVWSPGIPADAPYGGRKYSYQQAGGRFNGFSQTVTKMAAAGKTIDEAKGVLFDEVRGNFKNFLEKRDADQPFCYWFGPTNVHRKWIKGSGKKLWNIDPNSLKGKMPPFLPDVPVVREDMADYFGEVAAFDAALGVLLTELKEAGELDNTLIVVSGDHGAPGFPHVKCNLYDFGTGVPLAIAGPGVVGGRVVDDFVNLPDLAPTFLETGGVDIPAVMTARSIWPTLKSDKEGLADPSRTYVLTGRERHVEIARAGHLPYPQRAIRTANYQFVINFRPDRYPLGDPYRLDGDNPPTTREVTENTRTTLPDEDAGPTKAWLVDHRNDPKWKRYFDHAYGKRPREELFDMRKDPHQMTNVAADPGNAKIATRLREQLMSELKRTGDPRLIDNGKYFENPPLAGPVPADAQRPRRKPAPPKK